MAELPAAPMSVGVSIEVSVAVSTGMYVSESVSVSAGMVGIAAGRLPAVSEDEGGRGMEERETGGRGERLGMLPGLWSPSTESTDAKTSLMAFCRSETAAAMAEMSTSPPLPLLLAVGLEIGDELVVMFGRELRVGRPGAVVMDITGPPGLMELERGVARVGMELFVLEGDDEVVREENGSEITLSIPLWVEVEVPEVSGLTVTVVVVVEKMVRVKVAPEEDAPLEGSTWASASAYGSAMASGSAAA